MKIKHFSKKLSLHKNTVANLDKEELTKVNGGGATDYYSCIMQISCAFPTGCPGDTCYC